MLTLHQADFAMISSGDPVLLIAVGKKHVIIGFDISPTCIVEPNAGEDRALEIEPKELEKVPPFLRYTTDVAVLASYRFL